MMGNGFYGHGGSSPSSSSNLSPLAPPFTVDRFVSKSISNPLVDLTETSYGGAFNYSLHNWLGPQPPNSRLDYFSTAKPDLDSLPSSNAYGYSSVTEPVAPSNPHVSASVDAGLYGQNSRGFVEAKPYYPSYVSNAIGNNNPLDIPHDSGYDLLSASHVVTPTGSSHKDYTQSLSGMDHSAHWAGLWEGPTNWKQSEHVQIDGGSSSKEHYVNQELCASEGIGKFEEVSRSIDAVGMEKNTESVGREQLDYKSFLGEIPEFVPLLYSASKSSASTLLVSETCPSVSSLKPVKSWNHEMPYVASYENLLRKHDVTSSDTASIINSSPAIGIRPAAEDTCSLRNLNSTCDGDNKAFPSYNPSAVKEPHPFVSTNLDNTADGDKKAFCSSSPSVVLELDPFMSSEGFLGYDASQARFCMEQNEQVISGYLLEKNKVLSRNAADSLDASGQFSGENSRIHVPCISLEGFGLVGNKNEEIDSVKNHSDSLDHYNPAVDSPCWKGAPVLHFSQHEVSEVIKNPEAYRGSNLQDHQIPTLSGNDAVKVFPDKISKDLMQQESWSKGNCFAPSLKTPGVDTLKGRSHHTKPNSFESFDGVKITDDPLAKKPFDSADSKLPQNEQQSCEGDKWKTEQNCSVGIGSADAVKNLNDDSDDCSSPVPFHVIERVLCSPPSADGAPSKFIKSHGGDSTQKMYVRTLIDTMQNLSELVVFHFSNDACELKKDDYVALKVVISNLESCLYKNVEKMSETATSQLRSYSEHQLDPSGKGSQVSESHPLNVQDLGKNKHVQEEHNDVFGKSNEKFPNFVSATAAADAWKDDNMTQALKKALVENFHVQEETEPQVLLYKSLWLEAEASLFSASCIARFNRKKREMETCNSQNANENTVVVDKLSRSKVSSISHAVNMLASDAKGSPLSDAPILESPILSASSDADDTVARLHILKCRIDSSNTENTSYADMLGSAEKLSASEGSPIPNGVDKLAFEEKADISIQDAPVSSIPSHADDVEASVMARFHILKQRADNLTSMDKEEHQAVHVDAEYAGLEKQLSSGTVNSEDRALDVNVEPCSQKHPFKSTKDKLTVEEFHLIAKDDKVVQSCPVSMPGNQSRAALCDGSSDWEHVLLEELGQSS